MTTPATILRDSCVVGLALTLVGLAKDPAFGGAVAAGALGAIVNLGLLVRLVLAAPTMGAGLFAGRLVLKQLVGLVILAGLVAKLPAAPVLIGFCAVLLALAARAGVGLARGLDGQRSPLEPG
jgi:hypothetical protein